MLQVRNTKKSDYNELCQWWKWFRFPAPPIQLLDDLKYGIMVYKGGKNICAGFLYFTNAHQFGLLEYVVSSPQVTDRKLRKQSLELLINTITKSAKDNNMKVLFSSLRSQPLIETYKNCGWQTGSTNTTEMMIKL